MSPVLPLLVGFFIASCTTPAGVSGAFLLLPFQLSVLGFTSPGVTPTNLLYNVFSTPGAILSYRRLAGVDWILIRAIFMGTGPAVIVGSVLRVTIFADPASFKFFVGIVLLVLGINLVGQAAIARVPRGDRARLGASWIPALGAGAGLIGWYKWVATGLGPTRWVAKPLIAGRRATGRILHALQRLRAAVCRLLRSLGTRRCVMVGSIRQ